MYACIGRTNGRYTNPQKCSQELQCVNGMVALSAPCENGEIYDPKLNVCDIPANVECYSSP